ncbi:WD40 repeat domain-containing protein [Phormidium sp. CCY1219]|uniref:WD40 repeat domain-containing protein n=1 Tax=Phormidium sp. CCY1219 TaxID=2886104 RepID=UPI002D1E8928|nr:WD40 repeat domain-containing protein [Phormidium sp. CCY1219]MEB3827055.1 WD40 domain-containing protein [Phormidium sp. CCY1219]
MGTAARVSANPKRQVLEGHTEMVKSVAFSPDRKYLASADSVGVVRLWELG